MKSPPIHPQSCVECLNSATRTCAWNVHESLPITSDGKCDMCIRYRESHCSKPPFLSPVVLNCLPITNTDHLPPPTFERQPGHRSMKPSMMKYRLTLRLQSMLQQKVLKLPNNA